MAAGDPTRVSFTWPYKGVNTSWPQCAQPSLTAADALNVMTDEPQRGRSRGGSRNGTKKAFEQLLGDGSSSRRVSGLLQVTKLIEDPGTAGGGGSSSGLYDTITNQDYFVLFNDNADSHLEDRYPDWIVGTQSGDAAPSAALLDAIADGTRQGTWESFDPMPSNRSSTATFDDSLDIGVCAAARLSTYTDADNFQVEIIGICGPLSTCMVAARIDKDDPTSQAGTLVATITLNADSDSFDVALWKGDSLVNAVSVGTPDFGYFSLAMQVVGNQVTLIVNGTAAFTSTATSSQTRRAVAFGQFKPTEGSSGAIVCIRSRSKYLGNDFTELEAADDFSTYSNGANAEATGPFDVGTRMDFASFTNEPSHAKMLELLAGTRSANPAAADMATVGDDGDPFIFLGAAAPTNAGATIVRYDVDKTPADLFEIRTTFTRGDAGDVGAIFARVKTSDPTDTDGVIAFVYGLWPSEDYLGTGTAGPFPRFVLYRGTEVMAMGCGPIHDIGTRFPSSDANVSMRLRIDGSTVTGFLGDFPVCSATIAGQNTAARGAAFGSWCGGVISDTNVKARGVEIYSQAAAGGAGSPPEQARETKLIVVAGEDVYVGEYGDTLAKIDNARNSQRKPSLVDLFGDVYLVEGDGSNVFKIDVDAVTCEELVASAGSVPEACYVAAAWRGRLVLSGANSSPQNVYLSKAGDPTDWDYSPAVPSSIQAVALNASSAGKIGQPVIALVPWRDDVLVIGCDHGIYQLTGDPAAGGTLDAISEAIGFLTRDAWCMSPDGTIYFVGTSGFYRMAPGGSPENLALGKLQEYFKTIDRSSNYVMCSWERDRVGCYIFVVPRVEGAVSTSLWFDAKQEAFWPIQLPAVQGPLSTIVFDGDAPTDRYTLLGGHDGYVRRFDSEADQDDGVAIDSYVFIGPINPGGAFAKSKLIEMEVTNGVPTNGMDLEIRVGRDAREALTATPEFQVRFEDSGRHEKIRTRSRGNTFMLRIGNNVISKAWTLERTDGVFDNSGRMR